MKLPWAKTPEPLYLPAATVTPLDRPEPEPESDVLWERDEPDPPPGQVLIARLREQYDDPPRPAPRLVWTTVAPNTPGLYWWRPLPLGELPDDLAALECVVDYGGRMCTATHKNDSTLFTNVGGLSREWAGPIGTPEGMDIRKWWGLEE